MTENEAKDILEEVKILDDSMYQYNMNYLNALDIAIKSLEEIQQYRAIGTVEECREAVEKQSGIKPQKMIRYGRGTDYEAIRFFCNKCGKMLLFYDNYENSHYKKENYCQNCGQFIDWSDTD